MPLWAPEVPEVWELEARPEALPALAQAVLPAAAALVAVQRPAAAAVLRVASAAALAELAELAASESRAPEMPQTE
jgi:hypothetical protein